MLKEALKIGIDIYDNFHQISKIAIYYDYNKYENNFVHNVHKSY